MQLIIYIFSYFFPLYLHNILYTKNAYFHTYISRLQVFKIYLVHFFLLDIALYLICSLLADSFYFIIGGFFLQLKLFYSLNIAGGFLCAKSDNKNNTENSSSSAIRNGTKIKKWYHLITKHKKNLILHIGRMN